MNINNATQRDAGELTPTQVGHQAAEAAADHAERVSKDWKERAFRFLCQFGSKRGQFMTEEVREAAESSGSYVAPPDERAWGAVVLKAKRQGKIESKGYAPRKSKASHGDPKVVWQWIGGN